jgi:hypothetical protein
MSLINDALRRKKQESKEPAPETSGGSPMQPVAPTTRDKASYLGPILMTLIILVLLLAALLFWKGIETKKQLAAATQSQTLAPTSPVALAETKPAVAPVPVAAIPTNPSPSVAAPTNNSSPTNLAADATNAPSVPAPPPLKLQGIFYRPSNPTAMINGKTVGIGEVAAGARVLRIDRQEVAVERDGKLQILTLD